MASEMDELLAQHRARTRYPRGHVVHMSRDYREAEPRSLARCDCGWQSLLLVGHYAEQDAAIELHWQEVEQLSGNSG